MQDLPASPATVFLTTSGLGTRLEGLTQYTNKALVPIGNKYAICRIIERFPGNTRFVVTLGYYGQHVRDFLELAYPYRIFEFITVDPYEGAGSSQAFSMLAAKHYLSTAFYYHCCDTILPADYQLPEPDGASPVTLYVAPHADYITYSGITVADGKVKRVNRKREAIHDYAYIGLAYIANPALFWGTLEAAWRKEGQGQGAGDGEAYRRMLEFGHTLAYRVVPTFYDTGNLDSYKHACNAFPGSAIVLAKPNESLCFLGKPGKGKVLKFLHSAEANKRRIARGRMLEDCGGPKILGERENFLAMSYEEGDVLAECREWGEVRRLLDWAQAFLWVWPKESEDFRSICYNFYSTKTRSRLAAYFAKQSEDYRTINGCFVGTVSDILNAVPWDRLCTNRFTRYHGDFILDNILRRPNGSFVLLDWRDSFDTEVEHGDPAYDLAKLRHNLVFHHSNIAAGEYTIQKEGEAGVFVDLKCNYLLMRQVEELDAWIAENGTALGTNALNIRILQAIIWLNMAPLYDAPLSDFLFAFGKWNLWLATRKERD